MQNEPLQRPLMPYPPADFDRYIYFLPSFHHWQHRGEGVVPFCNLLILAIIWCSYTGDILYYICATVTYTTFTSAICYPHEHFAKVYF